MDTKTPASRPAAAPADWACNRFGVSREVGGQDRRGVLYRVGDKRAGRFDAVAASP